MYDFCLDVNKDYTAVCYRILNKHFGVDRIFRWSSCYRSDREVIFLVFLKWWKNNVQLLKRYLSKKIPEVDVCFYLNRRSNFVHMGLHVPLFSVKNYPDFIAEINKFLSKDLGTRFEFVYSQLVLTVKWKFDYIICRKVRKEKWLNQWIHMYQSLYQRICRGINTMAELLGMTSVNVWTF